MDAINPSDLASDAALYAAFNKVADYYDAKIPADLIRRGIISGL